MDIGRALKLCRSAKKLSLGDLARRAQLSQSYLSMIETSKRDPSLSTVEKLAEALQISTPLLLFLAASTDELVWLDAETTKRLSAAALEVMRA
jgi:transcriptional regulator with XRE-family HTH domain